MNRSRLVASLLLVAPFTPTLAMHFLYVPEVIKQNKVAASLVLGTTIAAVTLKKYGCPFARLQSPFRSTAVNTSVNINITQEQLNQMLTEREAQFAQTYRLSELVKAHAGNTNVTPDETTPGNEGNNLPVNNVSVSSLINDEEFKKSLADKVKELVNALDLENSTKNKLETMLINYAKKDEMPSFEDFANYVTTQVASAARSVTSLQKFVEQIIESNTAQAINQEKLKALFITLFNEEIKKYTRTPTGEDGESDQLFEQDEEDESGDQLPEQRKEGEVITKNDSPPLSDSWVK